MSNYDYIQSRRITDLPGVSFYALIMAAMRNADTENEAKLREAWPDTWKELVEFYHTPGALQPALRRKIKDLPGDEVLDGQPFIHPQTGETCYWRSQWEKGVWFRKSLTETRVYPIELENAEDALEFEIPSAPTFQQCAEATLLFHSGSPWDARKKQRWLELTGQDEATTRVLCDMQRAAFGIRREDT